MDALSNNVHALASKYGWTEEYVLRLPTSRRNKYIDLINEDIQRENREAAAAKRRR